MLLDYVALFLEASHGGAYGMRLPSRKFDHVFKACACAGLQEGEQLRRFCNAEGGLF